MIQGIFRVYGLWEALGAAADALLGPPQVLEQLDAVLVVGDGLIDSASQLWPMTL